MHTFYMPTIFFMKIHDPAFQVDPMNLKGPEYFVYGQMFLMFIFLQSHVVFGSCRALAAMDGVHAPNDTPVSHLRSSLSVRQHWNNFHVSWRDFFLRYIYSFSSGGIEGIVLVILFSSFIHGFYAQWYLWGALNFLIITLEQVAHTKRIVRDMDKRIVVAALNQTLAFLLQLLFFVPFSVVSKPVQSESMSSYFTLSLEGLVYFGFFNFFFSIFNCTRVLAPAKRFYNGHSYSSFW
mmetsp:Transcript_10849/g.27842  ORF Transcript_10849/g.27842 Transcript_10849/m.27842 type:complete len:236 (-) Transcript_10849:252-959(-)